jgi:tetratricopeptide (TPR) repeat protein
VVSRVVAAILLLAAGPSPIDQAETLAAKAIAGAAAHPDQSLIEARKALTVTADFEPTAYVRAGRKGEVVEDAFVAARGEYRRHRSRLYEAVGVSLASAGRHDAAARYLRRAFDLDPAGGAAVRLARSLIVLGRGREALDIVLAGGVQGLDAEKMAVAGDAADAAGLPSLQAEIDHVRILALRTEPKVQHRDGPFVLPERTRLSSGAMLRFDTDIPTLLYAAEPKCRTCSADLEALKRLLPASVQVVLVPPSADQDQALRGVVSLYRYTWPFAGGPGVLASLRVEPPAAVLINRRGFSGVGVRPPFNLTLPTAVEALTKADVQETVPRSAWNHRPVERRPKAPRPTLLENGLAPGEDDPPPPDFVAAVDAFGGGKPAEALRLFGTLEARGDGWLLPPEARFDRALCLARLARREEARLLLLHTGDSRLQEELDRALEGVGSPPRKP